LLPLIVIESVEQSQSLITLVIERANNLSVDYVESGLSASQSRREDALFASDRDI
jgi:hypothetical protein